MKFQHKLNSYLPIIYVAVSAFGVSMSIAGYGVFLPLLMLIFLQYVIDRNQKRSEILETTDTKLYFAYIIIFVICSIFNGDGNFGRNSLLVNYFLSVLIYLVISMDIKSTEQINKICNTLLILLILNCVVTLLQYVNNPIGWSVWFYFNDAQTVRQVASIENMDAGTQMIGRGNLFYPGIFPSQVYNGYIVGSLATIALYKFRDAAKMGYIIIYGLVLLLIAYSLIVIQQRMAFFLFIIVLAAVLYYKSKPLTVVMVGIIFVAYLLNGINVGEEQLGRLVDLDDKNRYILYSEGLEYVISHLWVGGRSEFMAAHSLSVHNVILNAFMYGGFFGAILIMIIYMRMCMKSLKIIIASFMGHSTGKTSMFAYALLIYNIISLTHNNSLLTGDPIIWVLYGLMLLSLKFEKNGQRA